MICDYSLNVINHLICNVLFQLISWIISLCNLYCILCNIKAKKLKMHFVGTARSQYFCKSKEDLYYYPTRELRNSLNIGESCFPKYLHNISASCAY